MFIKASASPAEQALIKEQMATGKYGGSLRDLEEAFGTADFTKACADVAHNAAMKGYGAIPANWRAICSVASVNDFKARYVTSVDGIGKLEKVIEEEEYSIAKPSDRYETYTPYRYGKVFPLSMEARANDATGGLNRQFTTWGAAAANTLNYYVFSTLLGSTGATMGDGNALFDATNHGNYATSKALNFENLETGIEAMMAQTDQSAVEPVNIWPRYLIVGPDLAGPAMRLTQSDRLIVHQWDTNDTDAARLTGDKNVWKGLEVIVAPEVTATHWILAADPNLFPTIEMGFYNGQTEPQVLLQGPDADSEFFQDVRYSRIRLIFGGQPLDWRTFYKGVA